MTEFLAHRRMLHTVRAAVVALVLLVLCAWLPTNVLGQTASPDQLRARYAALRDSGSGKIVDRRVYLQSLEQADRLQGDVFAIVDHPHPDVRKALARSDPWCGILILHLNIKYCRGLEQDGRKVLVAAMGRKFDQPLSDVHWMRFGVDVARAADDYMALALQAAEGPMGTSDYRIAVESAPLPDGHSLIHVTYEYRYGTVARLAMSSYLATLGSDKVGFSVIGQRGNQRVLVGGVRGVLERNTMRFYLAIESYLSAMAVPVAEQPLRRLQDWFDATEQYALQLHELDRAQYLSMKQRELQRQATQLPPLALR